MSKKIKKYFSRKGVNAVNANDVDVTPKEKPVPKGCMEYNFNGFKCVASNQKNATRKYEKLLQNNYCVL